MTTHSTETAALRAGLPINWSGAAAALATLISLLAMVLWADLRPWTGIVLMLSGLWWLKEIDQAWTRRARRQQG
ncbi:hypothetical protein [Pseudactinotalea terrae]|uniref:hypothetical protein n=1 Tax=Pseudactinotalea terrae TaxID=1743262 RepID=UPI0012E1652B|nr:hypothetical protein [Pseudactinotalea terrae]